VRGCRVKGVGNLWLAIGDGLFLPHLYPVWGVPHLDWY
jgi:hypothetical protein